VAAFLVGVRWGTPGVAASFSLTYTFLFWSFVKYATRNSPVTFSEVFSAFALPFSASSAVGLVVWIWRWDLLPQAAPALALASSVAVFAAGYFLVALLFTKTRTMLRETFDALERDPLPTN